MASAPLTALNSVDPSPPAPSTSASPTPSSSTPPSSASTVPPPNNAQPPPASPPPSPPPPQSPPPAPPQSPPPQSPSPPPPVDASPPPAAPVQPSPALPNPVPNPTPPPTPSNNPSSLSPPLPLTPPEDTSGEFTPPPPPSRSGSGSGTGKLSPGGKHGARSASPPSNDVNSSSGSDNSDDSSGGQSSTPPKADDSGSNQALFTGIGLGIGLFIIVMLISALVYVIKKKRKPHYYPDGRRAKGAGTSPAGWQGKGMDHNIKIPPAPGLGGGGWQQHSPTPVSGAGGMDSGAYSASSLPPASPSYALGFNKSTFSYEELSAATGGFSPSNMIGQGGFGYVYKGVLPTGKEVAVKQLKSGSGQGEREFQAEVEIISRVHHRHLVSLVGYCITGVQRMLIYEFVPNNTLEYHLHGKGLPTMDWPTRLKIAIGSAKGLAYLHEDCHPRIIHRDIKASNILIDYKFEAMVADFGLAKLNSDNNTHVSTRVMGTFGYLAPEYASSGKLSEKSDVFSFGVMLLELISGRKPVDHTNMMEDSLVDWARPMLGQVLAEEKYEQVVDPKLEGNYSPPEMARMIACAAASVRHSARRRPKMSQIVRALEGDIVSFDDLNDGVKPGQSSQFGGTSSTDFESGTYSTKMRQFRRIALEETNEYNTQGDYSGITSEYGLNPSDSSAGSSGEMRFADQKSSKPV